MRNVFARYKNIQERIRIPLSGNRYTTDIDGVIKNADDSLVDIIKDGNNDLFVKLDWFDGFKNYSLAEVIAFTFKTPYLHFKWWKYLSVIFADENKENLHPSNLVWKFPIGLGSDVLNGFAFIPMFSRYMINKQGVLFDTLLNRTIVGHQNCNYHSFVIMPDVGDRTSLKRHRALCLAFTDYPANVDSMDVNHINGNAGNDELDNLEWCTPSENIIHAFKLGLRKSGVTPILVRDIKTGIVTEYNSISACSKELGLSEMLISGRLSTPTHRLNHDGLQFKRKTDNKPWYIPKDFDTELANISWKKKLLIKNVFTNEIFEFDTQREGGKFLNLAESVFTKAVIDGDQKLYKKDDQYFLFKRKSDQTPWRDIKDPINDYLVNTIRVKPVLVKHASTGEIVEYDSAIKCANALGILASTLNYRLSLKGQKLFRDGTLVKYKDEKLPFADIDSIVKSILKSSAPCISNSTSKSF